MRLSWLIILMIAVVLAQFAWASHWQISGVYPNLVLVILVVVTLRAGSRAGLLGALIGGLAMLFISPFPLGGQGLALLAAMAVSGFLAEYVFTAATPFSVLLQAVVATVVFGLVNLGGTHLIFLMRSWNTEQLWSVELVHTLGQVLYHLVLIFVLYNLTIICQRWWQNTFRGFSWRKKTIL